jgi:glucose/arabinose dehydrogenase
MINRHLRAGGKDAILVMTALVLMLAAWGPSAVAEEDAVSYEIETVAEGFDEPWGMAFLPDDGRMLVTERPGNLKLVDLESGTVEEIGGVPEVDARDQGGLLDVALHPDFVEEPWVYLTWAGSDDDGLTTTYIGRGLLDMDALALTDLEILLVAEPHTDSAMHYGSRLVFDNDNRLYITVGDRRDEDFGPDHVSQDLTNYHGKTLRLEADGSVPSDNPFVDDPDAQGAIYSYGHRNSQGMAVHPETGEIWQNEHGEYNGDEINVIQAGGNYGWPIATYGVDYETQERFAELPEENPDTIAPVFFWAEDHPEGFPPSGLVFYTGDAFPEWQGHAFMGNLAHEFIGQFAIEGHEVTKVGRLLGGQGWRIRDLAVGPDDGFLYVLIDDSDVPLVRLRPAQD